MTQTANMVGIADTDTIGAVAVVRLRTMNAFQSQMNTDLDDVFFGDEEFAEPCVYTHSDSGSSATYNVLFDDPTQNVNAGSKLEATLVFPQVMIPLHQMALTPDLNDTVRVRGIDYKIDTIESDGVGVATLLLVRVTGSLH